MIKRITTLALTCTLCGVITGCVGSRLRPASQSRDRAFITYKAPPAGSTGLRLAVKDLIDIKGEVTSAGSEYLAKNNPPAERDAECLRIARQRGVFIVGKTNVTEFAVSVSGMNAYYGTPKNQLKKGLIPGGSSSGSAVAVASGAADVAFGTDTAGSIRVPAACCGVAGLKTTHGLVSIKGVFPISPKYLDTVGPMAKDITHLVKGMDLLQEGFAGRYAAAVSAKPSGRQIKVGRLYLDGTDSDIDKAVDAAITAAGFKVVRLNKAFVEQWKQAQKDGLTIATADAWQNDQKYTSHRGVSMMTKAVVLMGKIEYETSYADALRRRSVWKRDLDRVLEKVDFIALPTLKSRPPTMPHFARNALFELRVLNSQNTVPVNLAGVPALAMPIPMESAEKEVPVTSLQLIGRRLSEAQLLNAGRIVEARLRDPQPGTTLAAASPPGR